MGENGYSLSDIANAAGGFGGEGMWIVLLIVLLFCGGGFGWNRNSDFGQYATAASQQDILFGQKFSDLDNKIDRLGNGLCDSTYALNNSILGEGRALQSQLSSCCCENQRNTDALRYDVSQMIANTNATTVIVTLFVCVKVGTNNVITRDKIKIKKERLVRHTGLITSLKEL